MEAPVHVRQHQLAFVAQAEVAQARHHRRFRARDQRQRVHAGNGGILVEEFEVAPAVEVIEARARVARHFRSHSRQRVVTEGDQEAVLRKRPGAMEITRRPARRLGEANLRREAFDGVQGILARPGVEGRAPRIQQDQRSAHVGMVRSGHKEDLARTGNRMGLIAGVDPGGVIAEEARAPGTVRVREPQPVEVGCRPVHIVPPGVDDLPVVRDERMPLVGFVKGQANDLAGRGGPTGGACTWAAGSQGLWQRPKPPRRLEMNAIEPSGSGHGSKSSSPPSVRRRNSVPSTRTSKRLKLRRSLE